MPGILYSVTKGLINVYYSRWYPFFLSLKDYIGMHLNNTYTIPGAHHVGSYTDLHVFFLALVITLLFYHYGAEEVARSP